MTTVLREATPDLAALIAWAGSDDPADWQSNLVLWRFYKANGIAHRGTISFEAPLSGWTKQQQALLQVMGASAWGSMAIHVDGDWGDCILLDIGDKATVMSVQSDRIDQLVMSRDDFVANFVDLVVNGSVKAAEKLFGYDMAGESSLDIGMVSIELMEKE